MGIYKAIYRRFANWGFKRLVKQVLSAYGNVDLDEIEKIWHGLALPYINLFAWLEKRDQKPKISFYDIFHPMMLAHPLVLEKDLSTANPKDFIAEYKWDGLEFKSLVIVKAAVFIQEQEMRLQSLFQKLQKQ